MKVPFFRLKLKSNEQKRVREVLKSGWVTTGPRVKELEDKIGQLTGAAYVAAVSSCTAGLHLVLKALSIGTGDEVITTPFTMVATIEAILHCGARPVLADIDPITLNIDPDIVEKVITPKTRAILAVDIAGWPCRYDRLRKIAGRAGIYLIEDAAHAFGAAFMGKPVGSKTDAAVFSFYATKNITSGEGGMVVSNSRKVIQKVRHLSLHGMTSSGWKRYSGGNWKYDITDLGYKYNMSDLTAGLALGQLSRFKLMQAKRTGLAARYIKNLKQLSDYIELPYSDEISTHAWHLFIIKLHLFRLKITRDRFIEELEKAGVGCGVHFIPIYKFTYYRKNMSNKRSDFQECEKSYNRVISLPLYPDLNLAEVDFVCEKIGTLIKKYKK